MIDEILFPKPGIVNFNLIHFCYTNDLWMLVGISWTISFLVCLVLNRMTSVRTPSAYSCVPGRLNRKWKHIMKTFIGLATGYCHSDLLLVTRSLKYLKLTLFLNTLQRLTNMVVRWTIILGRVHSRLDSIAKRGEYWYRKVLLFQETKWNHLPTGQPCPSTQPTSGPANSQRHCVCCKKEFSHIHGLKNNPKRWQLWTITRKMM